MATSRPLASARRRAIWPAALGVVAVLAGCGAGTHRSHDAGTPAAFAWLHPGPTPAGWKVARLPSDKAALAYPPAWRAIHTDAGTVSVALAGPRHRIDGFLNATPLQGAETLANWARFRTGHIREEGSRHVRTAATATGLRFRSGQGSCVMDDYSNGANRYREIACLVKGARATTVVVGAAPVAHWAQRAAAIESAVSSFVT